LENKRIECTRTNVPKVEAESSPRASKIIETKFVPEISTWSANAQTLLPIPKDLILEAVRIELMAANDIELFDSIPAETIPTKTIEQ